MNHCHPPHSSSSAACANFPSVCLLIQMQGHGPGRCNIMAHLWFILTSPAQTEFSSPSSFFTLSSDSLSRDSLLSLSLSFHIFFLYLILTFAIFQHSERKNSSPRVPLPHPPSNICPFSSLYTSLEKWQVTGHSRPCTLFFSIYLHHLPFVLAAVRGETGCLQNQMIQNRFLKAILGIWDGLFWLCR